MEQGRKYRAVAIYNMDHKQYDDKSRPRVQRRPPENPMEVVVGDVHHMDVLLSRPDGSTFTPKIVAWLDWATSRIFTCPVFLKKGEGIRQEHVVEAFIAMVKDKRWGMPQTLYLDNGTEYYWTDLINNAQKLNDQIRIENLDTNKTIKQKLKARRSSIINAKPYNASAKVIEGTFGFLERIIFSTFPGHIGGNRTNKKTANVGKLPAPYTAGENQFRRDLAVGIEYYETYPQYGFLKGKSPRQVFTDAVAKGWQRMDIDHERLPWAFTRPEKRTISQGGFSYKSRRYTGPEIERLQAGTSIIVHVPICGGIEELPVHTADGVFCRATVDIFYDASDTNGAREASRRQRANKQAITEMKRDVVDIDMLEDQR
ncbi:MAG: hypothetical protein RLP02_23495, partial [Coleofasciculus sp. C2-GNP5-27]